MVEIKVFKNSFAQKTGRRNKPVEGVKSQFWSCPASRQTTGKWREFIQSGRGERMGLETEAWWSTIPYRLQGEGTINRINLNNEYMAARDLEEENWIAYGETCRPV